MELITLKKNDEKFKNYLDGSFSKKLSALPLQSLNHGIDTESVTFRLSERVRTQTWFYFLWRLLRPQQWILSLGPMITTLAFCLSHTIEFSIARFAFSVIGIVFLHISLNLFNDFDDYMSGFDHSGTRSERCVIQNGWVRACDVRLAAWITLSIALALGSIIVLTKPLLTTIIAGGALLIILEMALQPFGLKRHGLFEFASFLLSGPLLTLGLYLAITPQIDLIVLSKLTLIGCTYGVLAVMCMHLKNFENIMADQQAKLSTWVTRSGFEASQNFHIFLSIIIGVLTLVWSVYEHDFKKFLLPLLATPYLIFLAWKVLKIRSPLSSELRGLNRYAISLGWLISLSSLLVYLWS